MILALIVVNGVEMELRADGWAVTTSDFKHEDSERVGEALLFGDRIARRLAGK